MNRGGVRNPGGYSTPRGRSSRSAGRSSFRHAPIGADGSSNNYPIGSKAGSSHSGRQTSEWKPRCSISKNSESEPLLDGKDRPPDIGNLQQGQNSPEAVGSSSKQPDCFSASDPTNEKDLHSLAAHPDSDDRYLDVKRTQIVELPIGETGNGKTLRHELLCKVDSGCMHDDSQLHPKSGININEKDLRSLAAHPDSEDRYLDVKRIQIVELPIEEAGNGKTLRHELLCKVDSGCMHDDSQLHPKSGVNERCSQSNVPQYGQASPGDPADNRNSVQSECSAMDDLFDICLTKTGTPVMLKPSLLVKNREKRNELKRSKEGKKGRVLGPGMVLLKNYLSIPDQVNIVKICRACGLGSGGFYQPGYRDGATLHLKMMCLGKNWDPEKSKYGEFRPSDGAKPPVIPVEFNEFVKKAIQDSHTHIREDKKASNVEEILPWMSPNICIVNFYNTSGRLGLHQDRDESVDSLHKGLPVVSFSIGDSAEFLYGDQRDADKADKIELESGDVLIFGGKSRHIFHGVSAIRPSTAPKSLLEGTNLRPGRLNLTFRQY